MSNQWRWDLSGPGAEPVQGMTSPSFPTQSEAESWVGEQWPALVEDGIEAVTLLEGDTVVYGPMSLRPAE